MRQTSSQYIVALLACALAGWFRHVLLALRRSLVLANRPLTLVTAAGGSAINGGGAGSAIMPLIESGAEEELAAHKGHKGRAASSLVRCLACACFQRNRILLRLIDVLLFGAAFALGYLNMLAVMAMNGGIFAAVVAGEMIGVLTMEEPGGLRPDASSAECH